jgi:hypothetical protein
VGQTLMAKIRGTENQKADQDMPEDGKGKYFVDERGNKHYLDSAYTTGLLEPEMQLLVSSG